MWSVRRRRGRIAVEGEPVTDFYSLDPRGIVEHGFHDPDRFYVDPATIPSELAKLAFGRSAWQEKPAANETEANR